jgi:hypothetical protein
MHLTLRTPITALVASLLASLAPAQAETIFSHAFDEGTGALNSTPVDTGTGTWVATSLVNADGVFTAGTATNQYGSATLAFAPSNGFIYQLDASLTGITGNAQWVALGFANGRSSLATSNMTRFIEGQHGVGVVGTAWMIVRGNNTPNPNNTFLGTGIIDLLEGTKNSLAWPSLNNNGGDLDLRIILNTLAGDGNWTATWFAKPAADSTYTQLRAATTVPLADQARYTSVGFAFSNGQIDGVLRSFSLTATAPDSVRLSGFSYDPVTGASEVSIKGRSSKAYLLVEAAELDFANPDQSPVPLTGATVGVLVGNQVTTDTNGDATVQFNLGTAKPATFIRGEEAPPPPPLLSQDFEGGALPVGWAVTDNGNGTAWSVGMPNGTGTEPDSAIGGSFCAGTNINANTTNSAGCSLVSPAFTVPAGGATLTLSYYIDTEAASGGQDFGTIRLLNAADGTPVAGGVVAASLEGITTAWLPAQVIALPAAANGLSLKLEFAFEADADGQNFSGFYIDDVKVTVN